MENGLDQCMDAHASGPKISSTAQFSLIVAQTREQGERTVTTNAKGGQIRVYWSRVYE